MSETVVDLKQLREMLHHFDTLHIAFQDDEYPYIVPMNFGIGDDKDKIVLYIYTPREGKMTRLIKENPHVGIQAETLYEYFCKPDKTVSNSYSSILGKRIIEPVSHESYNEAMESILTHCGYETYPYNKDYIDTCYIYKIILNQVTGKNHFKGENVSN